MAGNPVRVAILGGGLAGSALLQALLKHDLDVHIFESAPKFRESGVAIGLAQNAISALDLMGLRDRLTAAKAVQANGTTGFIAQGKDTGKISMEETQENGGSWIVQRSLFLAELLQGVHEDRLHPGKKLIKLSQEGDSVVLDFEDGTTHECDVLIGADGIHSIIRKHIVGEDDPSASPTFAGWQCVWTVAPFDDAVEFIGTDLINTHEPRQYCWCGKNTWIMHDQLSDNTLVQCVIAQMVDGPLEWKRKTNKAEMQDFVKNFDHPIGMKMVDLLTKEKQEYEMVPLQHHSPQAPRYVKGRIAIMGDAADSPTPWRGSGGGMSLEDAYILGTCFGKVKSTKDVEAALKAYETIQKPRRSKLVTESYRAGLTFCGCEEGVDLDADKMKVAFANTWDWIVQVNLSQQADDAVKMMEMELEKTRS